VHRILSPGGRLELSDGEEQAQLEVVHAYRANVRPAAVCVLMGLEEGVKPGAVVPSPSGPPAVLDYLEDGLAVFVVVA
jgi:hypothetical protein